MVKQVSSPTYPCTVHVSKAISSWQRQQNFTVSTSGASDDCKTSARPKLLSLLQSMSSFNSWRIFPTPPKEILCRIAKSPMKAAGSVGFLPTTSKVSFGISGVSTVLKFESVFSANCGWSSRSSLTSKQLGTSAIIKTSHEK